MIVHVVDCDSDMPTDQFGNIADVVMDGMSVTKRINIGQLYEQYFNAMSDQITREVKEMVSKDSSPTTFDNAFEYIVSYYKELSPEMYHSVITYLNTKELRDNHVKSVLDDGIYIHLPTDSTGGGIEAVERLEQKFGLKYGPVTYRGLSGNIVTTKEPIIIASKYMMLLESTPNDYSAVSTSKLSHFGIPAKLTNNDKNSSPVREQPARIMGESESCLANATIGSQATADILDLSNNPLNHKVYIRNILESDAPTNMFTSVDRELYPLGNSRTISYVKHIMSCGGVTVNFSQFDPNAPLIRSNANART